MFRSRSISLRQVMKGLAILAPLALIAVASERRTTAGPDRSSAAAGKACQSGFVHAVIADKHACLRAGQPCVLRYDRQYHRSRFHCHTGRLVRIRSKPAPPAPEPSALPPAGRVVATIPVDGEPAHVAFGDDSLWLTTYDKDALLRIGAGTSSVAARVELPASQEARWLGAGEGAVWVSNFTDNTVSRIDAGTNSVAATIPVVLNPTGIGFTPGAVWATNHRDGSISHIDPQTNRVLATLALGPKGQAGPQMIAGTSGALWATVPNSEEVLKVGLASSTVLARLPGGCGTIAADDASVWFEGGCDSTALIRADSRTNQIVARIDIGERQAGNIRWIALGLGSVWVTTTGQHLLRIDPATNRIVGDLKLEGAAQGTRVAVGAGSVWVGRAKSVVQVAPEG